MDTDGRLSGGLRLKTNEPMAAVRFLPLGLQKQQENGVYWFDLA
jgi:hypothetical protein